MKKDLKIKVTVLGAGNMGTAIAQSVARNGFKVDLWNHEGDPEPLAQIKKFGENKKYLAGVKLSKNINPVGDLAVALSGAQVVFFVVPSNVMSSLIKRVVTFLPCGVVCVDASKGIDEQSLFLVSDLMKKTIPACLRSNLASISGPAIARDLAEGKFTAMDLSAKNLKARELVITVMESDNLKLFPTDDIVGVEVAGSFKNVYAIAMGWCDGLGYPMNTKAALLVMALKEIGVLVKKMGGREDTVFGLAGLGDLVGTGLCAISRNRSFGEYMANGLSRDASLKKVGQTVEGVNASKVLIALGKKYKTELPFAKMVYDVVWKDKPLKNEIKKFLKNFSI